MFKGNVCFWKENLVCVVNNLPCIYIAAFIPRAGEEAVVRVSFLTWKNIFPVGKSMKILPMDGAGCAAACVAQH